MAGAEYLLGLDVGSSSIKASILDAESGELVASATSPEGSELSMDAQKPGWAEQEPETWWEHVKLALAGIGKASPGSLAKVAALGISYQMHGLVVLDKDGRSLRPSIIWCDSRAVPYGQAAFTALGERFCLEHFLNSPGNFTAAKLAWLKENEPAVFEKIAHIMLPGDYIAYRLSGEIATTPSGLSEGILWDAMEEGPAYSLMDHYGFPVEFLPPVVPNFAVQARLSASAAEETGLKEGTLISYRAGDQPNNALSLKVLEPGELATTAGTSGVVYGVADYPAHDSRSRVNTFVHVNHRPDRKRYGVLMCLNGTGITNRWLKQECADNPSGTVSYEELNRQAEAVSPGGEGLFVYPYGNGAERTLENADPGALFQGFNFNIHTRAHLIRAGQEGIVFALNYGLEIMREMGMKLETVRAGYANMFLSPVFRRAFADTTGAVVELYDSDGSQGAARGAGIGASLYSSADEAFVGFRRREVIEPSKEGSRRYSELYQQWRKGLERHIL